MASKLQSQPSKPYKATLSVSCERGATVAPATTAKLGGFIVVIAQRL